MCRKPLNLFCYNDPRRVYGKLSKTTFHKTATTHELRTIRTRRRRRTWTTARRLHKLQRVGYSALREIKKNRGNASASNTSHTLAHLLRTTVFEHLQRDRAYTHDQSGYREHHRYDFRNTSTHQYSGTTEIFNPHF